MSASTSSSPTHGAAVFLSYAREDSEVVRRLADALRAAGLEVWFDQNELVGGDAWDAKIRKQIKECALFVPIVSARTEARREGYFRIEWKLAAQRTHAIADGTPFLVPVVIDATGEGTALVPEEFRHVQWTRLPQGEATPRFVERVKRLVGGEMPAPARAAEPAKSPAGAARASGGWKIGKWLALAAGWRCWRWPDGTGVSRSRTRCPSRRRNWRCCRLRRKVRARTTRNSPRALRANCRCF